MIIRVLVVDDEPSFLTAISDVLSRQSYEVVQAKNGDEALRIFPQKTFNLVISDIQMPGMGGLELFQKLQLIRKVPVVLMTGFTALHNMEEAQAKGVKHFLSKPFQKSDLIRVLEDVTQTKASTQEPELNEAMCRIDLDEFVSGSKIFYPIYACIQDRYVKIAQQGEDLPRERLADLKARGLTHLFMRHDDYVRYTGIMLDVVKSAHGDAEENKKVQAHLLEYVNNLFEERVRLGDLSESMTAQLNSFVSHTVEVLSRNPDLLALMATMVKNRRSAFDSGLISAVGGLLICKGLGWNSLAAKSRVLLSALLHDIGEKELSEELILKDRIHMTAQERQLYESHTLRGYEILSAVPAVPKEVAQVALQHHENLMGLGFPSGRRKPQIIPLAQLITVADEFCVRVVQELNAGRTPLGAKIAAEIAVDKANLLERAYVEALRASFSSDNKDPTS